MFSVISRLIRDEAEQHLSGIIRFKSAQIFTAAIFRPDVFLLRSLNGKYTRTWKLYSGKYNRNLVLYFFMMNSLLLPIGEDKLL